MKINFSQYLKQTIASALFAVVTKQKFTPKAINIDFLPHTNELVISPRPDQISPAESVVNNPVGTVLIPESTTESHPAP